MIVDNRGVVQWVSGVIQELPESPEQVIGKHVTNWIHPNDIDQVQATIFKAMQFGKSGPIRCRTVMPTGIVIFESTYVRIGEFVMVTSRRVHDVPLSPREIEIISLVCEGHSSGDIAEQLGLALSTVETHRINISRKTGCNKVAHLVRWAISRGLIVP